MKQVIRFSTGISFLLFLVIGFSNCTEGEKPATTLVAAQTDVVSIDRGQHLVIAGGCNDCHSPKIMTPQGPKVDSSRLLSGHPAGSPLPPIDVKSLVPGNWVSFAPDQTAAVGPWGLSFSANLTPDSTTGIGAWSEFNFVNAMRTGRHMGLENGRPIAPPMPWENLNHLSDNDLKSIFAYLKSLPPVHNKVEEPFSPDKVRSL